MGVVYQYTCKKLAKIPSNIRVPKINLSIDSILYTRNKLLAKQKKKQVIC